MWCTLTAGRVALFYTLLNHLHEQAVFTQIAMLHQLVLHNIQPPKFQYYEQAIFTQASNPNSQISNQSQQPCSHQLVSILTNY